MRFGWYKIIYAGGSHGRFAQRTDGGSIGDITGT